jgi:glutamine amidotransferase
MVSVAVIEYGVGNLGSVVNACLRAGCEPSVVSNIDDLERAAPTHIVLPGVGAIGEALSHLRDRGFEAPLSALVRDRGVPALAICVGMQMLAETCTEFGEHRGLGWIPGASTARIAPMGQGVRLPHMGWNNITVTGDHGGLLDGLETEHFYFLHSYAMRCGSGHVISNVEYEGQVTAAVREGNVFGVQFHPEKSNQAGARLMSNFFAIGQQGC